MTGLMITWTRVEPWRDWAELSEGFYLLRTNLVGVDAATLWKRYIQLTDAEWAFRIHKDELAIRPIWHHKTERVLAHILVCFLAYVLWKTLAQWMQRSGLEWSFRLAQEPGSVADVTLLVVMDLRVARDKAGKQPFGAKLDSLEGVEQAHRPTRNRDDKPLLSRQSAAAIRRIYLVR